MTNGDWFAQKFEDNRRRLRSVAYRMLGSFSEADDAVQETWLRLNGSDASAVKNIDRWLITVVGRVCLDQLRMRRARKEECVGTRVPDLILSRENESDPEHEALVADSVGIALLIVLRTLSPSERLAFVLHDMFAVPFEEIASIVGGTSVAARQLASRARRRVRGAAPIPNAELKRQRGIVDAFFAAVRSGDFTAVLSLLSSDVIVREHRGTLREVQGASAAAKGALAFARFAQAVEPVLVNGVAGIVSRLSNGEIFAVMCFTIRGDRIAEIDVIRDPNRLDKLDVLMPKGYPHA